MGGDKEMCLRGLQVSVGGSEVLVHTTIVAVGEGAALKLENNLCDFNKRDGSCKTKATNGGHGLVTLVTPTVVLQVGAAFMNNHEINQPAVHHWTWRCQNITRPANLVGSSVKLLNSDT